MARKSIIIINKVYDKLLSFGVSTVVSKVRLSAYKFPNKKLEGEEEWVKKWSVLGHANRRWYGLYSHFIGTNIRIVPDDIMSNVIEPILNPVRYRSLYEDKNMLDNFFMTQFAEKITPLTLLRNINGIFYTGLFKHVDKEKAGGIIKSGMTERLISKASIDENSGRSIYFWQKDGDVYKEVKTKLELSVETLLCLYPNGNYILQEVVKQSEWMSYFCPTSVNTLRIHMYRSVKDNKPHLVNAVLRMGRNGSLVDNSHAGGAFCGIRKDGSLGDFVLDQSAVKQTIFNGIDFSKEHFVVPEWDKIEEFCNKVMLSIPHMRNLALDVMINVNGEPRIIEYNTDKFALYFYQLTTSSVFDEYTDEVIEYCCQHKDEATRIFVTF